MDVVIARMQAAIAGIPGITAFFQPVQDIQIGTRVEPDPVPVHADGHRRRRTCRLGTAAAGQARDPAGTPRRRQRPAGRGLPDVHHGRPRRRDAPRACRCRRSRTRCTTVSASGRSRRSSARPTSIASCWRPIRFGRPTPTAFACCACRVRTTCRCRCPPIARIERVTAPLVIAHQEQFPAVTLSFDLAPGALARAGGRRPSHGPRRTIGHAGDDHRQLCRRRGRVPVVAVRRTMADPGGGGGDLHRAGRAVRELDPPDHHPVHAAVGRDRRAAGADDRAASICRWWRWSASCC